jgi:hypothetical protein
MDSEIKPDTNYYKYKRYWPPPPITQSIYEYQDVNNDVNLQLDVTNFYYNKLLLWLDNSSKFSKFKKFKQINKKLGIKFIYKLLKNFINKYKINWYDLRLNHASIKIYIYNKLLDII